MKIKYAGPRAMISQHGIGFKDGKEDKYVYLMIGLQILQAIDKDYKEEDSYSYDTNTKRIGDTEMLSIMQSYELNLEEEVQNEKSAYELKINKEIDAINCRDNLKAIEKKAWINNIKIMKNYRIQRAINKIYYMHCIHKIKEIIKRENIKEIDTPFYEKYWHVLETIRGNLEVGRDSVKTNLHITNQHDGNMIAKLVMEY